MRQLRLTLHAVISLLLLVAAASPAYAQFGRNKIQYKNHKWKVLSTPHFDIHFYEGAEGFAARAGLVLEDGYAELSEKLQETLPWKVPVILYSNHNDFLQTNVSLSMLSEGVQAFAEPSRKRIVLPFTGSYPAFAHTAIHELAHVFTFQIVYNRLLDNVFSRNALFGMPLWIAEGVAEYLAVGWDAESDMFIRDAVINDYLPDLQYAGGFMVYKAGQSLFNYIEDTYGPEKVLEILDALAVTRHPEGALERTVGLTASELSQRWKKAMRKRYWPLYSELTEVEDIARRLTNHIKERANYNTKPVISPDGERIAYFSDRDGLISIYLISVIDGKVIRKLVSGHRSNAFESLHFFTSSLAFSPDGSQIVFVAKSGGRDMLYIVDTDRGRVVRKIDVRADGLSSPDWSPLGDEICVTGIFGGQSDLLLVNLETEEVTRLTRDVDDQLTPRYFPDGRRIAFKFFPEVTVPVPTDLSADSRNFLNEMDFLSTKNLKHGATFDLYSIDKQTLEIRPLVATEGNDESPVPFDGGRRMLFTSTRSGISNLYVANLETGEYRRITDVLGGIFTPDVHEGNGRIAFSAFFHGGYDVYVSDDLEGLLNSQVEAPFFAKSSRRLPKPSESVLRRNPIAEGIPMATLLAKAGRDGEKEESDDDSGVSQDRVFSLADEDSIRGLDIAPLIPKEAFVGKASDGATSSKSDVQIKSDGSQVKSPGDVVKAGMVEGVSKPVAPDDPGHKGATVADYRLRLAPDFIGQGGGLYFSTGFGFGLANTIALSDMLGNHRMALSFNLFRDIADSDILATYIYLKRRINYGIGAFQYKNFLNSRVTTIGESFSDYRLFTERNYGVFGLMSVPFTAFDRIDLELEAFVTERQFFEEVPQEDQNVTAYVESGKSTRNLIEPSATFVHDAAFYDYFGPIDGSRWMLSVSKGFGYGNSAVSRSTAFIDYRKYMRLWYRNSLAFRIAAAGSEGPDSKSFFLGGPSTLRGYDYLHFEGSRMALMSLEYRYPMVDALILGWPGRWGLGNLRGTAFFDVGTAWDNSKITPFRKDVNGLVFQDLYGDIGLGAQMFFGYFLLNFQIAWQTDLNTIGHSQFHFYIGPSF